MRILLIGEYSRLHNSLKEGLVALGHEVILVSDGDGFKRYSSDFYITPKIAVNRFFNIPRQLIFRIFKFDIAKIERGIKFYRLLPKLKNYDVVQLINEAPIQTTSFFEKYLLNKIITQNKKAFLLCCGIDYTVVKYMLDKKPRYSLLNPYFENTNLIKEYRYIFDYVSNGHKKVHDFLYEKVEGIIASDMDYYLPLKGHPKFLGLIPNPVNLLNIEYTEPSIKDKIIIFLGINQGAYHAKGIPYFEQALKSITSKYKDKIEVIVAQNIPYNEYIELYKKAHIILDQVYGYDQGYNALEAMAAGKVVFTGAESEFQDYYQLTDTVAINALPDVESIVKQLSFLIENPEELILIGNRARKFIEKEHHFVKIAEKYLESWNKPKI